MRECQYCDQKFSLINEEFFKNHKKKCRSKSLFECEYCAKIFTSHTELIVHYVLEHECSFCKNKFPSKSNHTEKCVSKRKQMVVKKYVSVRKALEIPNKTEEKNESNNKDNITEKLQLSPSPKNLELAKEKPNPVKEINTSLNKHFKSFHHF